MSEGTIAKFQKDILTISDLVLAAEIQSTQVAIQGFNTKLQLLTGELQRRVEANLKVAAATPEEQAAAAAASAAKAKVDQAAREKIATERALGLKKRK